MLQGWIEVSLNARKHCICVGRIADPGSGPVLFLFTRSIIIYNYSQVIVLPHVALTFLHSPVFSFFLVLMHVCLNVITVCV